MCECVFVRVHVCERGGGATSTCTSTQLPLETQEQVRTGSGGHAWGKKQQPTVNDIPSSNRVKIVRICMYVCKYDKGNPFFSEWCNLNWQYSGCYMVCIFQCFAPWKLKKKRKRKMDTSRLFSSESKIHIFRTRFVRTERANTFIASSHGLFPPRAFAYVSVC